MKSRLITYSDRDAWNNFVASSPESPILQSFEWGEFKSKFGWQPMRIVVEDDGKMVAGISILRREIPYLKYSLFYAPRGPVVDFNNPKLLGFLLDAVEKESDTHRAISLKIDPDLNEEKAEILADLKRIGFVKAGKQIQPRATILLDLSRDLDEILKSFDEKTRYNVRLAARKGVEIREDPSLKGIRIFCKLYRETALRDKFLIHPEKYYRLMNEIIFKPGFATNFIAYYDNQPIASVIIFCFGSKVWYMYGASSSEYRNLMPNHLLHWHVIQWAKEKGYKTYDLWGIPANPKEGHPLWGVYRFKKGFSKNIVRNIGAYDFPYSPLFYNAFEFGVRWWQNLRSLATKGKIEDSLGE